MNEPQSYIEFLEKRMIIFRLLISFVKLLISFAVKTYLEKDSRIILCSPSPKEFMGRHSFLSFKLNDFQ